MALAIVVVAGAVLAFTGLIHQPVTGADPSPVAPLPTLPALAGHAGQPSETAGRIAQSADYQDPAVKTFVAAHTRSASGASTIAEVSDLWEAINANWSYVKGPPDFSYYHAASYSITSGMTGNCLDYAILNAAVITSLGGKARVVTAYEPTEGGHAYTEVYMGDTLFDLQAVGNYIASRYNATTIHWHTTNGPGGKTEYWLNLDWQAKYPGGPFFLDNGTYYASYLSGTGERYRDNGDLVTGTR